MPKAARFVAISATLKWEAELLWGCFIGLDLPDPIRCWFGRGKYVVQGGAVVCGGLVLVVFNHVTDSTEKGFPGGWLSLLHVFVLLGEVNIADDVDCGITGLSVGVSCWEGQRVAVQVVQHITDHKR